MDSTVSIVVPVYNKAAYLSKCIDSILAQTHTAWQLILVDDGSTDASGDVCDCYAAADPRIEACHIPNGGVSRARNHGIGMARGRYITFIDADDYVEPDFLARMVACASESGCEVVIGGYVAFDDAGDKPPYRFSPETFTPGDYRRLLGYEHWGYTWGKLYLTDFLRAKRLLFPAGIGYGEDGIFFERALACRPRVYADDSTLYRYRLDPVSPGPAKRLDYDVELHTLHEAIEAADGLATATGDSDVLRLLTIYPHIWRVVLAVYSSPGLSRGERLRRLRAMRYRPCAVHMHHGSSKERLLGSLVIHRHFALFDLIYSRIFK